MTPQTLRKELREKFAETLNGFDRFTETDIMNLTEALADAALEVRGFAMLEGKTSMEWKLTHDLPVTEADMYAMRESNRIADVAIRLEVGLKLGQFPQGVKDQQVYKWILKQEEAGQKLEKFIDYVMGDPRRRENAKFYHMKTQDIKRDWPRAFDVFNKPSEYMAAN